MVVRVVLGFRNGLGRSVVIVRYRWRLWLWWVVEEDIVQIPAPLPPPASVTFPRV